MNARSILIFCLASVGVIGAGPVSSAAPEGDAAKSALDGRSAPVPRPSGASQIWHKWSTESAPVADPVGEHFLLKFINRQAKPVRIYWQSPAGQRKFYYEIRPGGSVANQKVRKGAVWFAMDSADAPLGYFVITPGIGQAVIPQE